MTADTATIVQIHKTGGPETLTLKQVTLPPPGDGEVRLRQEAVGLNFIDVYHRTGLYPLELPFVPGGEAAGVVEAVGPGVTDLKKGDRVGYGPGPLGGYASARNIAADALISLPDTVSVREAAAVLLKGMTVEMLIYRVIAVQPGWHILVHAAAGGVGQILCRWAAALGVHVIGTAGSPEKAAIAKAAGCEDVILYEQESVAERVRELTDGKGVNVAYDSVGAATFEASLDSLAPRGMMVSYGNASGPPPAIAPLDLARRGCLFLTRPTLQHYGADRAERLAGATRLFDAMAAGHVQPAIGQEFPLSAIQDAHRALEARTTTGSTILIP